MREWWNEKDYLGVPDEKVLSQDLSAEDIIDRILDDIRDV